MVAINFKNISRILSMNFTLWWWHLFFLESIYVSENFCKCVLQAAKMKLIINENIRQYDNQKRKENFLTEKQIK